MVTMGKLPQTPRAKKVIEFSIEEARGLNHNYVGTEHILLGLVREAEGVASQVLMNLGLGLEGIREEVLSLLGQSLSKRDELKRLDVQIESLNFEKEQAVAEQNFDKAVRLHDRADTIKKNMEKLRKELAESPVPFKTSTNELRELVRSVKLEVQNIVEVVIIPKAKWDEIVRLINLQGE